MTKLDDYIALNYKNNMYWFTKEVNETWQQKRILNVFALKDYLINNNHKVKLREDMKYKDKTLTVKKLILQNAKTILNFQVTYLLGHNVSLSGSDKLLNQFDNVYKYGGFNNTDYTILDNINKYNNAYEYVYKDGNRIKSKIIKSEDGYPVIDDNNNYIGFIEHYTTFECIDYYTIYDVDKVVEWTNDGGELHIISTYKNKTGLPIIYGNLFEENGLLTNIIPTLDEIEDLLSKLGDSIYINSLNPLLMCIGQQIEGNLNKDGVGYCVNLENGSDMKYVNAEMDYNCIKLYLDKLCQMLNFNAYMPSIVGGNENIANVSEVSLKLLYQLADVWGLVSQRVLRQGFDERIDKIRKLIGIEDDSEYINVNFNYSRPQNASELLDNIKKQFEMNAISLESIIEKSPITEDTKMELDRLKDNKSGSEDKTDNDVNEN